jgi:fatty-acid desaturase
MTQLTNPIWEQRDILSHSINLPVTRDEELLIDAIITNLINKTDFQWNSNLLSLTGEARLQQSLRHRGYDLYCANLNVLPESTKELSHYIANYSVNLHIVSNLKFCLNHTHTMFGALYRTVISWLFDYLSSTSGIRSTILIAALLIWVNNVNYLFYALVVGYIVSNCMTLVFHEHWSHRQLCPKNRIIGFIFDYICHILVHDRISWIYSHTYHHKHWKTEQDIEVTAMLADSWIYYFMVASPVHGNPAHYPAIESGRALAMARLPKESQFLQKYVKEITILTHLIFLLTFGLSIYVYFLLFQIWIFHKYIVVFDELVTHYNNKTREEEVDNPYLFPICCGTAYHKSHHAFPDSIILGPGKLKYLNIQYYFIKLFYNITAKVPDTYTIRKDTHG